jgi:hypothetical protein
MYWRWIAIGNGIMPDCGLFTGTRSILSRFYQQGKGTFDYAQAVRRKQWTQVLRRQAAANVIIKKVRHRSRATHSRQPRQVRKEATVTGSCVCSGEPVPGLFVDGTLLIAKAANRASTVRLRDKVASGSTFHGAGSRKNVGSSVDPNT